MIKSDNMNMFEEADFVKIASYLEQHKKKLASDYVWSFDIESLKTQYFINEEEYTKLENKSPFERGVNLKQIIGSKLKDYNTNDKEKYKDLCLWVVKNWGGIRAGEDETTIGKINAFVNQEKRSFNRIASTSKIASFIDPENEIIYDARVAYSINWILLSTNINHHYFPMPMGRNSRMNAFDIRVLIRLKNIHLYKSEDLKSKRFISKTDKYLFISEENAYTELRKLIKAVHKILWKDETEKENILYFTEMLLFTIADNEILEDILERAPSLFTANS